MGDVFLLYMQGDRQISKWVIIGGLSFLIAAIFTYGCLHRDSGSQQAVKQGKNTVYISIHSGMNAEAIAELLKKQQVIDSTYSFRLMAKLNGADANFKTGDYAFYRHMDNRKVLEMLVAGKTSTLRITVPEGYSVEQIARSLDEKGIVSEKAFCSAAEKFRAYDYMAGNSRTKYQAEGFLFPDTYEVGGDFKAEDIMKMMAGQFDHELTPAMRERAAAMNLSIRELVILASLVEKEAQMEEDRPIIAQVFLNRLKAEMPLQSCATIQYILGNPKAELSIQDTKIESPYNTYLHQGLPPGPIGNPGLASIKAVLYSDPTDYMYFVADKDGRHHFSRTYEEHLATIDKVQ